MSIWIMLLMALIVGIFAEAMVPGRMPGGLIGAIGAGLLGTWLGGLIFTALMGTNAIGPVIAGVAIVPAIVGAIIVVLVVGAIAGGLRRHV